MVYYGAQEGFPKSSVLNPFSNCNGNTASKLGMKEAESPGACGYTTFGHLKSQVQTGLGCLSSDIYATDVTGPKIRDVQTKYLNFNKGTLKSGSKGATGHIFSYVDGVKKADGTDRTTRIAIYNVHLDDKKPENRAIGFLKIFDNLGCPGMKLDDAEGINNCLARYIDVLIIFGDLNFRIDGEKLATAFPQVLQGARVAGKPAPISRSALSKLLNMQSDEIRAAADTISDFPINKIPGFQLVDLAPGTLPSYYRDNKHNNCGPNGQALTAGEIEQMNVDKRVGHTTYEGTRKNFFYHCITTFLLIILYYR